MAQITDEIETLKTEMEERGSSMTDGSPLVNIRKSLSRVRQVVVFGSDYSIKPLLNPKGESLNIKLLLGVTMP